MVLSSWRRVICGLAAAVVLSGCAGAPHVARYPVPLPPVDAPGCCGAITPAGAQLAAFLDGMNVDNLWQEHVRINWETGMPKPGAPATHGTHCSAFAAAASKRLDIYLLRPPEHGQDFLASAQERWLQSPRALEDGWKPVASSREAQMLANQGEFVVLVFRNPDSHRPGHIAVVHPYVKSDAALASEGPTTTQAGAHNFTLGTAVFSFVMHPGAWPDKVKMFAHATKFQSEAPAGQ